MKVVTTVIGVIVVLLLFGTMLGGINAAQTDERTDAFGAVVTAPAAVTADVALVADLYQDDILNVISVTSDLGTDVPIVDSYVAGTNTLTVAGLDDDATRTLTVIYEYDALEDDAVGSFFGLVPLLVVVTVIVILVAAGVAAFRR